MLKRFNATAREGAVLKDLEWSMPDSLDTLYQTMLSECDRRTPEAQRPSMKILLAWLAFSWRPLTLDECKALLKSVIVDTSIDLEEELQGRFSRYAFNCGQNQDKDGSEDTKMLTNAVASCTLATPVTKMPWSARRLSWSRKLKSLSKWTATLIRLTMTVSYR